MEHIPSSMTNFKITLKNVEKKALSPFIRVCTVFSIISFAFTTSAFAERAMAPTEEVSERIVTSTQSSITENEETTPLTTSDTDSEDDAEIENEDIITSDSDSDTEDVRAKKIEAYYRRYNLPLANHAEAFVASADAYGIDWRLVAAIGFIESTGGKFACKSVTYSPFGWGSCRINFSSYDESIDVVSKNLAGKNPRTAHFYAGKDLTGVLYSYNSVIPTYKEKILRQMEIIENQEVK